LNRFLKIFLRLLTVAGFLALAVLFVVVLSSAVSHQRQAVCSGTTIQIDTYNGSEFLTVQEIKSRIDYLTGGTAEGTLLSGVDFSALEKDIEKNPYIDNAEVYTDQTHRIVAQIIQRRPIMRVINSDGVSYYVGEKNERIPLHHTFTPHVIVALGNVELHTDTKRDSTVRNALFNLVNYIRSDDFLNAAIDQVVVLPSNEFDLIPRVGNHVIHFGWPADDVAGKFNRLKTFYKEGLTKVGWEKYKAINLKFDGQVIGERSDTTNNIIH